MVSHRNDAVSHVNPFYHLELGNGNIMLCFSDRSYGFLYLFF